MRGRDGQGDAARPQARAADRGAHTLGRRLDLTERKRRTYLFVMLLTLPTLPYVAVTQRGEEAGTVPLYVAIGVLLVGLSAGLATRRLTVPAAERVVLTVLPALIVGRLLAQWLRPDASLAEMRQLVTETVGPTLVATILLTFLAFDTPLARRWSAAIWAGFTGVLVPALVLEGRADPSSATAVLRQSMTLLIVLALASFLASLKSDLATERARAEASDRLARTDALTGALNRFGGEEVVAGQLAHLARYDGVTTVALLDLDGFKDRNDHLGHAAGDQALREIVTALHEDLRETDRLARWGGDELLVVLPGTTDDDARTSARRWRERVEDLQLVSDADRVLTVSIGIAEAVSGDSLDDLLQRADRAMYRAKAAGGDRTEVAPQPLDPRPALRSG